MSAFVTDYQAFDSQEELDLHLRSLLSPIALTVLNSVADGTSRSHIGRVRDNHPCQADYAVRIA